MFMFGSVSSSSSGSILQTMHPIGSFGLLVVIDRSLLISLSFSSSFVAYAKMHSSGNLCRK